MSQHRVRTRGFSLSVEFRTSAIAGRGVFAKQRFEPGQTIVAYAPKQTKVDAADLRAIEAAANKITLFSEGRYVIVPDTSVPGGWLCNHSCSPNAAIFSAGAGRIQCTRPIARGEEITVFYGWVTRNEARSAPCLCGSANCRGIINFDISDADAQRVAFDGGKLLVNDEQLMERLVEYAAFLQSIGQEHVQETIANTFANMRRARGQ